MKTVILRADDGDDAECGRVIREAALVLARGGLVAFPTETVYGLGANALDPDACRRIYIAKGRPSDNPLILHISRIDELEPLAKDVPPAARALAAAFWPGPLTLVLRKTKNVPSEATGGLETVAVRFPAHRLARRLIRAAGFPVAAPSANASGRPSPTAAAHVSHDLNGKIDMIIDGGPCALGLESTIVDVTTDPPVLLRPGSVTREALAAVAGRVNADPAVLAAGEGGPPPRAPGMKYTHYAPLADVTVVNGSPRAVARHILKAVANSPGKTGVLATDETFARYGGADALVLSAGARKNPETIAAGLFATLRAFDLHGVEQVYAEGLPEDGVGLAIMNRLKKAAGFKIIDV